MDDRAKLGTKWKKNEDELNRIARMIGLDQQLFGKREEESFAEQDAIEFELGSTAPVPEQIRIVSSIGIVGRGESDRLVGAAPKPKSRAFRFKFRREAAGTFRRHFTEAGRRQAALLRFARPPA